MFTTAAGILASLATLGGIVWGVFKWASWKLQKTQQQVREEVAADIAKQQQGFEQTGRPQ